jgi:hypothetical protein
MRDKLIGWRAVYPTSVWRCPPPGFTILRDVHKQGQNACGILQLHLHNRILTVSSLPTILAKARSWAC